MSEETHTLDDLVDRVRPAQAANLLLWMVLGFFALILLWAIFTKLDRTVHGQGKIVPTAKLQTVSNLEGGIVEAILVSPGDSVKAGAPLIRLDRTASSAELGSGTETIAALEAKVSRLSAEIDGKAPHFADAGGDAVGIEQALYRSRMADLASLDAAAQARVAQADRQVSEAAAALNAKTAARDAAKSEADLIRPLVQKGVEPRITLVQQENAAAIATAEQLSAAAALSRAKSAVAEARATANQARQDWRAKAAEELASAQAELSARRRTQPALADKVRRTTITAPLAGKINRVLVSTVGGSVRPGDPLVEIVPSDGAMTVEVLVKPEDIAFVAIGQPARVKISAYDYAVYGALDGSVVGISPDAVTNERTGESHYTVRVRTTGKLTAPDGQALPIGPGMVADVNLIGDKRSVLSYILTPVARLRESAFRER